VRIALILALFTGALLDHVLVRVNVGKELARVLVFVPRNAENRWLVVQSAVMDEAGGVVWDTSSTRQLDGLDAPVTHPFELHLPRRSPFDEGGIRKLAVRADVLCGSAEAQAYIP
jgi:hypothetical protein